MEHVQEVPHSRAGEKKKVDRWETLRTSGFKAGRAEPM
jgi:hypothetical protein